MCGIAGAVAPPGTDGGVLVERARAIAAKLAHRGPDSSGEWHGPGIALAHRRLSILDPGPSGDQPMASPDGRWVVVYNGIIYNHAELRRRYGGSWRTGCDTETLLRVLEVDGVDGVTALVGMFAFAAWDREENTLYLARDRIGIKPLHYAASGGGLEFASEAQALARRGGATATLDREALGCYFAVGYPPVRRTLFSGVRSVLPGEIVEYRAGELQRRRYWRLPDRADPLPSADEWQEELAALWEVVAREHLLSDVPVGLFLSGGMDSSAVAIALAGTTPAPRVFSVRFAEPQFDEFDQAESLCRTLGLECAEIPVDTSHAERIVAGVARHSDLPVADSSMVGTWLLCERASEHVKVALSGDGGDEVFGGYLTHRATEMLASPLGAALRLLSTASWRFVPPPRTSTRRISLGQKVSRFLRNARHGALGAHLRWRTLVSDADRRMLIAAPDDAWASWEAELGLYPEQEVMNRALAFDVQNYLVQDELVRADRMSMAHGLEIRVPFLDHRLVELAFRMPYAVKSRRGRGKRPVARWLEDKGYGEIARRPKRGFNHPLALWFQGPLGDRVLDLAAGSPLGEVCRRPVLEAWLAQHRSGRRDRGYELWAALVLLEWADAHQVRA